MQNEPSSPLTEYLTRLSRRNSAIGDDVELDGGSPFEGRSPWDSNYSGSKTSPVGVILYARPGDELLISAVGGSPCFNPASDSPGALDENPPIPETTVEVVDHGGVLSERPGGYRYLDAEDRDGGSWNINVSYTEPGEPNNGIDISGPENTHWSSKPPFGNLTLAVRTRNEGYRDAIETARVLQIGDRIAVNDRQRRLEVTANEAPDWWLTDAEEEWSDRYLRLRYENCLSWTLSGNGSQYHLSVPIDSDRRYNGLSRLSWPSSSPTGVPVTELSRSTE